MGAQKGPKWSPKASQDGAKKEKKSEVKLGRLSVCLGRVKGKRREVVTRPLGEKGRPRVKKTPPRKTFPSKNEKRATCREA